MSYDDDNYDYSETEAMVEAEAEMEAEERHEREVDAAKVRAGEYDELLKSMRDRKNSRGKSFHPMNWD